jgi:predicted component of type VI protein secretion system
MPDLSTVIAGLPSSERPFCEAIEATIRKHEPRISWVRVKLEDVEPVAKARRTFTIEITLKASATGRPHISGSVDMDASFRLLA